MRTFSFHIYFFLAMFSLANIACAETHADAAHKSADAEPVHASLASASKSSVSADSHISAEKKEAPVASQENAKKEELPARSDNKSFKVLPSDVRVLIDVSGSMKQTDPKNLRKPALNLIARLLPDKSRAGIWTFGNSVNMLMPLSPVDAAWRKQAAPKANEINSVAMFTNIGKALDEVSFDRKNLSADYKTHIILLTDGVVDIGKDAVVNNQERQRIISEILPTLKSAGYIIHTIALSSNADGDLLSKLSIATDGISTTAISAEQLMPVFLKIFDQAVPAERVPLENNGFLVDASIKEFTALIFRKPDNDQTIIVSPEGKEYSATNPNDGINWYRTESYDLITADTPKAGQWKIKTEIAPQSRITVVSNLQLVVEPLKNNLHSNDSLAINYSFNENDKTIANKDFLGLLDTSAIVAKTGTEENFETEFTSSVPADGIYHQTLTNFSETGDYEVHLYVDGKTFKREFKHSLSVRDSMFVVEKNNTKAEDGKTTYKYKITTDEKLVDVKKTQISVSIKNSQNNNIEKPLNLLEEKRWEFSFSPVQEGEYAIDIHAQGEMFDGSKIDETLHVDKFSYTTKSSEATSSIAHDAKEEPVAEEKPKEESSNLLLYISIGVGNLLILGLGFLAYRMLMGGKAKDELAEFEKTLAESGGKAKSAKPDAGKSTEKTEIDLSDEDSAHIPMNDDASVDKLFPLDSMDESTNDDDNL